MRLDAAHYVGVVAGRADRVLDVDVQDVRVALPLPCDVSSPEFNALRRELSALLHSNHARVTA